MKQGTLWVDFIVLIPKGQARKKLCEVYGEDCLTECQKRFEEKL